MRPPHHLSPTEFQDYAAHMSRLEDATLSTEDHKRSQEAIDKLLWKDPDGRLNSLEARLAVIESHLGIAPASGAPVAPVAPPALPDPVTHAEAQKAVGDEIRQRMGLKDSASVVSVQTSPGVEGYAVFHTGPGEYTLKSSDPSLKDFGPYDSPARAQSVADRLNAPSPAAVPYDQQAAPPAATWTQGGAPANPAAAPPQVVATSPTEVHARPAAAQSEDGRGRPANRFKVAGKRGNWFAEDTTGAIPAQLFPAWKLKKDCINSVKGLNGHPNPDSLFAQAAPAAAPVPPQPNFDENAPIENWDPDPIAAPEPLAESGYAEPVGPTEANQIAQQGVAPAAIPATGHTNAPVAGGGVIAPSGDVADPAGVVIHKPSHAEQGIHLMSTPTGVQRVDPMGLGDLG